MQYIIINGILKSMLSAKTYRIQNRWLQNVYSIIHTSCTDCISMWDIKPCYVKLNLYTEMFSFVATLLEATVYFLLIHYAVFLNSCHKRLCMKSNGGICQIVQHSADRFTIPGRHLPMYNTPLTAQSPTERTPTSVFWSVACCVTLTELELKHKHTYCSYL